MKKTFLIATAMLALSVSLASAAGINLSFSDCGVAGNSSQLFDCASNSGAPFQMIASFVPPAGIDNFLGISSQVDFSSSSANLPDWWKHGTGQCRGTGALTTDFNFLSGPFTCVDFYQGQAAGGTVYDIGLNGPNRARLRVQCAVPIDSRGPVSPASEYYAFRVNLGLSKSAGVGACAGCSTSMCIVLNDIQLFQPPDALNDPDITNPANSNFVTWQASSVPGCPLSTPTHNSSWGMVKSLYR